jgi:cytochrome b561
MLKVNVWVPTDYVITLVLQPLCFIIYVISTEIIYRTYNKLHNVDSLLPFHKWMGIVGFNANTISAISWRSVVLVEKNTNLSQVTSKLIHIMLYCVFCNICNGNGQLWSWAYGSWIYNYLCKQWLSPLTLWVWMSLNRSVLDTTLL